MTLLDAGPSTGRQPTGRSAGSDRLRQHVEVRGVVQGVGFRPFVYALATEHFLTGHVANDSGGVIIEVEGEPDSVRAFVDRVRSDAPPLAVVESVDSYEVAARGGTGFVIGVTVRDGGETPGRGVRTLASPDVATCDDCLGELTDPTDRRYRHPFITCTNCGPRFTIITELPYDRVSTTMAGFGMCERCRGEYADPANRRFHAQPIACHDCGPQLELVDRGPAGEPAQAASIGADALQTARSMLAAGKFLAIKGLGGYHLACDAGNERGVAELRRRKRRGGKPFAVMVADLEAARKLVRVDEAEAALLTGPRRPIVLLRQRSDSTSRVAPSVSPRNPDLGVLLPYTPLHVLLLGLPGDDDGPEALVMTSGNLSGEPIVHADHDALVRLDRLVDAWLRHDRPIRVPCDDSVARVVDGEELPIRRSRGYAPMPIALPFPVPPTLATGGDLKNTCCLAEGRYAWVSQHVGDMDDLATLGAFEQTQSHLRKLTGVNPTTVAADRHPAYRSTAWARDRVASPSAAPSLLRTVQHHHAHVASVMAEHGLDGGRRVIGIAFDGTGFGTDGAVWGGEVLLADYASFDRFVHLAYVPLPGGDTAVHRPYRMALAHLWAAGIDWAEDPHWRGLPPVVACPRSERQVLARQLETGFGCVPTSSMGRLFDAVSSLAGVRQVADFEAEAAVRLEGRARVAFERTGTTGPDLTNLDPYAFDVRPDQPLSDIPWKPGTQRAGSASLSDIPWKTAADGRSNPLVADAGPVIRAIADDVRAGVDPAVIAARFHLSVANLVVTVARQARDQAGLDTVVLSGGVFCNALLLSITRRALREHGFDVLVPRLLPPNDGGLGLGQVMVAAAQAASESDASATQTPERR